MRHMFMPSGLNLMERDDPIAAARDIHARLRTRVAFATNHAYLPQGYGGSESSTHDLVEALTRVGFDVSVSAALLPEGVIGFRTRVLNKLFRGKRAVADRIMGYSVYRGWPTEQREANFIRQARPDIAIIQAGQPLQLAYRFIEFGIPTIVYFRDVEFDKLGGNVVPHKLLRFVANSAFTASRAKSELGVDSVVIPPLVWPERYRTETSREKVVFINPHPRKGVETALKLAERRKDIPFLFVESWSLPEQMLNPVKARTARLSNVSWLKAQLDVRKIYSKARVVLMPSQWRECWGRVISEAQISGIPCLASDIGGLPESVGPGGILVDPNASIADWAENLGRLWDNESIYEEFSQRALDHSSREAFQPEVLTRTLVSVIREHITSCRT